MKKLIIIGASGFIGSALVKGLKNFEVHTLKGRSVIDMDDSELTNIFEGIDVVINLAGRSIFGIWTKSVKQEIYRSRINTTRKIIGAISKNKYPVKHFISASAVGIYQPGIFSDEYTENIDNGFLAEVVNDWENASADLSPSTTKRSILRLGIVMGKGGGAYKRMRKLTSYNLGVIFNNGRQGLSFICIDDLVRAVQFIIEKELTGVINMVSPEPGSYKQWLDILKKYTGAFIIWNMPGFLIRLFLGESSSLLLEGHIIRPAVLLKNNFSFDAPNLTACIDKIEGN